MEVVHLHGQVHAKLASLHLGLLPLGQSLASLVIGILRLPGGAGSVGKLGTAAGQVAMHLGLYGPTSTLSVGHASGSAILAYAADLLALRHSDALLCVASDVLTPEVEAAYAASIGRRGWCLAEGSVALVLERAGAARARGVVGNC